MVPPGAWRPRKPGESVPFYWVARKAGWHGARTHSVALISPAPPRLRVSNGETELAVFGNISRIGCLGKKATTSRGGLHCCLGKVLGWYVTPDVEDRHAGHAAWRSFLLKSWDRGPSIAKLATSSSSLNVWWIRRRALYDGVSGEFRIMHSKTPYKEKTREALGGIPCAEPSLQKNSVQLPVDPGCPRFIAVTLEFIHRARPWLSGSQWSTIAWQ